MGKIEELRERLYRKGTSKRLQPPSARPDVPRRPDGQGIPSGWPGTPGQQTNALLTRVIRRELRRRPRRLRTFVLAGGGLGILLLGTIIGYWFLASSGQVALELVGPSAAETGAVTTLVLDLRNKSAVSLRPGILTLTYGPGVVPVSSRELGFTATRERIEIGALEPGGELRRELRVRLFGQIGEPRTISAVYVYRPENVASELIKKSELTLSISRVPVALSVELPETIPAGEPVTVNLTLDSELGTPIAGAAIRVDLPPGFVLTRADPPASEPQTLWEIGELQPGETRRIRLEGKLTGEPEEAKVVTARFGRYHREGGEWLTLAETRAESRIASPLLSVRTNFDGRRGGTVAAGETLEGELAYQNNLPAKVENVVLTLSFPAALVELERLRAPGGFYDAITHLLTWNSSSHPPLRELAAGASGAIRFSLTLRSTLPQRTFADKNFMFPVAAVISSASAPPELRGVNLTYRDEITLKVESRLTLSARATYYDSPFPNRGPLPPRVGSETTYVVRLQLTNTANDLSDVQVRGILGGGVRWFGTEEHSAGTLTFNEAAGEVTWRIPSLPAATGNLRPSAPAAFTVLVRPAENQIGSSPVLLTAVEATGHDTFTGTELRADSRDLTTELTGDPRSNPSEWRVVR